MSGPVYPADSIYFMLEIEPADSDKWAGVDVVPSSLDTAIPNLLANELTECRLEITSAAAGRGRGIKTLVPLREGQVVCDGTGIKFTSKSKLLQFLKIPGHAVYNDRIICVENVKWLGLQICCFRVSCPSPCSFQGLLKPFKSNSQWLAKPVLAYSFKEKYHKSPIIF